MTDIVPFPKRIGVTMLHYGPVITEPHGMTELSPSRRNYVLEGSASPDPTTDEALVERVARAIADANMEDFEELRALHEELALAAIRAMEEMP